MSLPECLTCSPPPLCHHRESSEIPMKERQWLESQNQFGWKTTLRSLSPNYQQTSPRQPEHSTKSHVQSFLNLLQGQGHPRSACRPALRCRRSAAGGRSSPAAGRPRPASDVTAPGAGRGRAHALFIARWGPRGGSGVRSCSGRTGGRPGSGGDTTTTTATTASGGSSSSGTSRCPSKSSPLSKYTGGVGRWGRITRPRRPGERGESGLAARAHEVGPSGAGK